jgi:hypothetical protein
MPASVTEWGVEGGALDMRLSVCVGWPSGLLIPSVVQWSKASPHIYYITRVKCLQGFMRARTLAGLSMPLEDACPHWV